MLKLKNSRPLFVGGTRYVFQHPEHANRCIKVLRPDRTGTARKILRKDFKRHLPARFLDDQLKEIKAYRELLSRASETLWRYVPRYHGTEETDMGVGIVTQLMRNADGSWPKNLEQILSNGTDPALEAGIEEFVDAVGKLRILSRDLLPHNIIAVKEDSGYRVMLVDGIGNAELIPLSTWSGFFARRKTQRKIRRFRQRCALLIPS
ncbi:YrbL family protein [Congregibacter variabilis]|uniref:YrbL family protein n=1 Tax=Congregibacter variabilis TaxID=3081200 RepID=A0ABZ0I7D5_9GAMM|nr:YrbL family protein [Congregibacter sp. IMCC43200]